LRSISIVVASRQSNPFCSNLPASHAGDNRNRPHCGKRYTLETVVGLRIKTCISIFQYYATDSSLSETLFAEVHYQSQWFIQKFHIREQLHSETLKIAWFYRLRFNYEAVINKKIVARAT
jgi:hypothetical protein